MERRSLRQQTMVLKAMQRPTESIEPSTVPRVKAPRVGHKKSRKGCAQCKRRRVKCNEEAPCSNCVRHKVACSLAGGPEVPRDDVKPPRRHATASSSTSNLSTKDSQEPADLAPLVAASSSRADSPPGHFQILTGLIDRPGIEDEPTWNLDLQLMHHYMLNTRYIITEPHDLEYVVQIWQVEVPRVAFAFDYVMHALLGLSALHKAHVEPNDATRLHERAVQHLDRALMLHRSDNAPATEENASAKFIFNWLVALFAYAIPPSLAPIDAMVELLMLVKGIDASLGETWFWVSNGPFQSILTRGFQGAIPTIPEGAGQCASSTDILTFDEREANATSRSLLPEGMDFGLGHLDFMLGVNVMLPEDRRSCSLILVELKQMYDSAVQSQVSCSVASIVCFPRHDSTNFAQLIKRRVPQALIILAYYCVLLDILDTKWWIQGWATRVLRDVLGSLDEQWRHWVEWPVQAVLLKNEPEPLPSAGGGTEMMR